MGSCNKIQIAGNGGMDYKTTDNIRDFVITNPGNGLVLLNGIRLGGENTEGNGDEALESDGSCAEWGVVVDEDAKEEDQSDSWIRGREVSVELG